MNAQDKRFLLFFLLALIGVISVGYTFTFQIEFSTFAVAIAKVALAVILFWVIDNTLLAEIDTIDEIRYHKNTAYGMFVLGLWIALGLLISTA